MTIEEAILEKYENSTFFNIKNLKDGTIELQPLPIIGQIYKMFQNLLYLKKRMPVSKWVDKFKSGSQVFVVSKSQKRKKLS